MAQQRDNVTVYPAPVGVERGRLFRLASSLTAPDQQQAVFCPFEVFTTKIGNGNGAALGLTVLGRVVATRDLGKEVARFAPHLIRREHAISPDRVPPASAIPVSVHENKGAVAARLHPQCKPGKFVVPDIYVASRVGLAASHTRFVSFGTAKLSSKQEASTKRQVRGIDSNFGLSRR